MTERDPVSKIRDAADSLSSTLKQEGVDVLEAIVLVAYETELGPGMVSLSTEEAPEPLRKMMLTKALERK